MPDGAENSCARVLPGGGPGERATALRAAAPSHPAAPAEEAGPAVRTAPSALRPSLAHTGTPGPAAHQATADDTGTGLAEARRHPFRPEDRAPSAPIHRRAVRRGTALPPDHHPQTDGSAPGPSVPPLSAAGDPVAVPRPAHVSPVRARLGQPQGIGRKPTHHRHRSAGAPSHLTREARPGAAALLIRGLRTRTARPDEAPRTRTGTSPHPHH